MPEIVKCGVSCLRNTRNPTLFLRVGCYPHPGFQSPQGSLHFLKYGDPYINLHFPLFLGRVFASLCPWCWLSRLSQKSPQPRLSRRRRPRLEIRWDSGNYNWPSKMHSMKRCSMNSTNFLKEQNSGTSIKK